MSDEDGISKAGVLSDFGWQCLCNLLDYYQSTHHCPECGKTRGKHGENCMFEQWMFSKGDYEYCEDDLLGPDDEEEHRTHYTVKVYCDNCGQESDLQKELGDPVRANETCPNCQCKTANKYTPGRSGGRKNDPITPPGFPGTPIWFNTDHLETKMPGKLPEGAPPDVRCYQP